ncbi:hypothetical protein K493DRAFT_344807 [Basidiobolus meristosporus CBS 931.73]|uniref:Uncharacterized protein n=1 Tax=Basidiobolus meristosporus CBS 931.73 TaxID=1314790 RepID=A0A1Y1Z6J9_9FUNG|nr:hypothetical protein K493DRAFT_344807 [Basidiobolus meristosporus CBS 931.73]|eukprot:ORY05883.1 hypothetical protein K493DRAFT_344807 [Basidiobolus meristosporus CBS 931.73]
MLTGRRPATQETQLLGEHNHPSPTKTSIKRKLSSLFLAGQYKKAGLNPPAPPCVKPDAPCTEVPPNRSNKISHKIKAFSRFLVLSFHSKKPRDISGQLAESSAFAESTGLCSVLQGKKTVHQKQGSGRRKFRLSRTSHIRHSVAVAVAELPEPPLIQQTHHTYNVSLRKLHKLERRPLVQVLLIHQTMSRTRGSLQRRGFHTSNSTRNEKSSIARKFGYSSPMIRPRVPRSLNIQKSHQDLSTKGGNPDDNVPLGLLQKEMLQCSR